MSNYLIYPFKVMRITQNYQGRTSHYPHSSGNPKDYPLDEGGTDTGRDWMYCPCEEVIVKRVYGVGNRGINTLWLESTSKVLFADGSTDYATIMAIHANDDDLKKVKEGQRFKHGDKICREGTDGTSANHVHLSVGKGKITGNGWTQNTKGKYVLTTTGRALKPENAFWIDPYFTKVISSGGLSFKKIPTVKDKYPVGEYKVVENAPIREGPSTKDKKKRFSEFTENAQKQIKKYNKNKPADYFVAGMEFTVSKVSYDGKKYYWGECPSGWVCLNHCKKVG